MRRRPPRSPLFPSPTLFRYSVPELSAPPATARSLTAPGLVIGAATVRAALPVMPPLVALIVAEPGATAVTSPLPLTVATPGLLDPHVTGCPVTTLPDESASIAANCNVPPTVTFVADGVTVTEATEVALKILPVATVRASSHMYWSTGEPSPM